MTKLIFWMCVVCATAQAYEYGPPPRYTGGPGDNPLACSACHSDNVNGGPINVFPNYGVQVTFSNGSSYMPGGPPITITVSVRDPVNTHYGFQMSARLDSDLFNGQAGDFETGTSGNCPAGSSCQIVLCDDPVNETPKLPGKLCPAGMEVQFIEHAYAQGSQVSTTPYTFTWTPPATNVGPVHFYVAGNAVNGDLMATGADHVYTASYTLTPQLCPNGTPSIDHAISASAFGAFTDFASGSWIEVYGSNFASDTWQWQGEDFNGVNAPTSLAGVSVSIDGKPGFVWYLGTGQINLQAPADPATGSVNIVVNSCGVSSNAYNMQKEPLAAGLLAFPVNGTQYVAPNPAKPGDLLTIFGIGFGDVKKNSDGSPIPPGVVVTDLNTLANPITFAFGNTNAQLQYAGLAPGAVGEYQFNVLVPAGLPNGDSAVTVTLNGVPLPQKLFLTVHP